VWIIMLVAVGGIMIGVGALIVVISVMEGLDRELKARLLGVVPDIMVLPHPSGDFTDWRPVVEMLEAHPDVLAAAPSISEQVLVQAGTGSRQRKYAAELRGIDIEREGSLSSITRSLLEGDPDPGEGGIVLGFRLARRLGVGLGDEVLVLTTRVRMTGTTYQVRRVNYVVRGLFKSGLYEVDSQSAYMRLDEAQRLILAPPNTAQDIRLRVRNSDEVTDDSARELLREALVRGGAVSFHTWKSLNPMLFAALELEKIAMFLVLLLIVVVAAFNIIGTLVMMVARKTREIGILMAIGFTPRQLSGVFIRLGVTIGAIGTTLGTVIGLAICWFVQLVPIPIPEEVYNMDRIPVYLTFANVAIIVASSLAICLLASIVPARRAARLDPAHAIRYE
jgi:lipoprotein-releasing system permease protein